MAADRRCWMQALDQIDNASDFAHPGGNRCFQMLHATRSDDVRRTLKPRHLLADLDSALIVERTTISCSSRSFVLVSSRSASLAPLVAPHADGTGQAGDVDAVIAEADQTLGAGAEEPRTIRLHGEECCRRIEPA